MKKKFFVLSLLCALVACFVSCPQTDNALGDTIKVYESLPMAADTFAEKYPGVTLGADGTAFVKAKDATEFATWKQNLGIDLATNLPKLSYVESLKSESGLSDEVATKLIDDLAKEDNSGLVAFKVAKGDSNLDGKITVLLK